MLRNWKLRLTVPLEGKSIWGVVLLGLSVLIFAYRFANRDLCPFIFDEPILVSESRRALSSQIWVTHSPLVGTQAIKYGPTTMWLFALIHKWLGPSVQNFTLVMTCLGTMSNAMVAFKVGRHFGSKFLIPSTLMALVASSPYLFFWSRMAWDPIVNICSGFVIALLCTRRTLQSLRVVAIGGLLGFGLSTHPAMLPLALVITLLVPLRSAEGSRIRNLVISAGATIIVNLPYLYYVVGYLRERHPVTSSGPHTIRFGIIGQFLAESPRVLTSARVNYFFDTAWGKFAQEYRAAAFLSEMTTKVYPVLAWISVLGLGVAFFTQKRKSNRFLTVAAAIVWGVCAVFFSWLNLARLPHYQFSIWWIVLVAFASLLHWARRVVSIYTVAIVGCWIIAIAQMGFLFSWMNFIRQNEGTRGFFYGVPHVYQQYALRTLCERAGARIYVSNQTNIFAPSLQYIASVERSCTGKIVLIGKELTIQVQDFESWKLSYADSITAKLNWERLQ
jgi:hypothetical protein